MNRKNIHERNFADIIHKNEDIYWRLFLGCLLLYFGIRLIDFCANSTVGVSTGIGYF